MLGSTHKAFGVDRVVKPPVGHRCNYHPRAEYPVAPAHAHEHVIPAIAPSSDADAVLIDIGQRCQMASRRDLVVRLVDSQVTVSAVAELRPSRAGASSIHACTTTPSFRSA